LQEQHRNKPPTLGIQLLAGQQQQQQQPWGVGTAGNLRRQVATAAGTGSVIEIRTESAAAGVTGRKTETEIAKRETGTETEIGIGG
jgi:hypothetical protein